MDIPPFADIVKVGIMAFVFVFMTNRALRALGAAQYTTRGS
jgi:hypothetical protein